jgi:serine protease
VPAAFLQSMSHSHSPVRRIARPSVWEISRVVRTARPFVGVMAVAARVGLASALLAVPAFAVPALAHADSLPYAPGRLIVGYRPPVASVARDIRGAGGPDVSVTEAATPAGTILRLEGRQSVLAAAARIRRLPGISYAVPDYLAHAAGDYVPDDPGRSHRAGGWRQLQWNFLAPAGVDAPAAWANLIAAHHPGGRGVTVAVIDTGVAFRNWKRFRRSPDFAGTRFVSPCDLVSGRLRRGRCTDPYALDREGHGTFVAGMIAETTNNGVGVTGLAYGASIMPIRVLDANGLGDSDTIATGIRYAAQHGARVINLSLEFYLGITPSDIPNIIAAIRYAHARGAVVVAAAGNDGAMQIAYPARAAAVISVGATTFDRCLADYSDAGRGLDIVAPGGGNDSSAFPSDPDCHPSRSLPDVYQMTFNDPSRPDDFSLPRGWYGTSMAAPAVSGAAALVIASGVLGRNPAPDKVLNRLETTATPLGPGPNPNDDYGYGLLNAAAATQPAPYGMPTSTTAATTTSTTTATTAPAPPS